MHTVAEAPNQLRRLSDEDVARWHRITTGAGRLASDAGLHTWHSLAARYPSPSWRLMNARVPGTNLSDTDLTMLDSAQTVDPALFADEQLHRIIDKLNRL